MRALEDLPCWRDDRLARRLGWYRQVADNRRPAKYLIASTIPVGIPLEEGESALWDELDRLTPVFLKRWARIRHGEEALGLPSEGPNLLHLCRELAYRMLASCTFCRWHCRVDRATGRGKLGTCKLAAGTRVSSYFHHRGEELVYRGQMGSGTIFFTSCNLRCCFCQNGDISTDRDNGALTEPRTLATMAWLLRMEGCHNINWVGGEVTIHLHSIVDAIAHLGDPLFRPSRADVMKALGPKADFLFDRYPLRPERATYRGRFNTPQLWNSNFFMSEKTMKILRLLIDVWLPDFKFGPGRCAVKLSRTPWYWETVTRNLRTIYEEGEDFTIRHLVMPDHLECCTYPVMDWVAEHMPDAPFNVMDQFHPDHSCDPRSPKYDPKYEELSRRCTAQEIRDAYTYARKKGLAFETITYEKDLRGLFV